MSNSIPYLAFLGLLISLLISLLPDEVRADEDALTKYQGMYKEYQAPQFYFGGENSRFTWLNMLGFMPHAAVHHHHTRPLSTQIDSSIASWPVTIHQQTQTFDQYVLSDDRIDSIVIWHKSHIVYQKYKSHGPLDRHMSWSVTKVIVAAALARLETAGEVDLTKTVKHYLPDYQNTAWSDIPLQYIVDMTSGIQCLDSEGYDNNSCLFQLDSALNVLPTPKEKRESMSAVLKRAKSHRPPGEAIEYVTANTIILGFVIEAVTRQPLSVALSELIWQPMGAEADGMMLLSPYGESYGAMNARLNDVVRFGQTLLSHNSSLKEPNWLTMHKPYLNALTQPNGLSFSETMKANLRRIFDNDMPFQSRWQWDLIWPDGDMYKDGYSGQGLFVSPSRQLVIAWFGTADEAFRKHQLLPLARKLSTSTLFQSVAQEN